MESKCYTQDISKHQMNDKDIEIFVINNPKAYKRYKRSKRRKVINQIHGRIKNFLKILSQVILWICAVGGFVLSLIQFLDNK